MEELIKEMKDVFTLHDFLECSDVEDYMRQAFNLGYKEADSVL